MSSTLIGLCLAILLCLVACGTAEAASCRSKDFEGASYIVCSFDPAKEELRTFWRSSNGKPYRTFAALAADLGHKGKSLQFAMNGGMYQDDFRPVGLYIENGHALIPANTATLTGAPHQIPNFYKKPNGFSISATEKRASWRPTGFSRSGWERIMPLSPGRCSWSTGRSIRPLS